MKTFYTTVTSLEKTFQQIEKDVQKKTLQACINTVNIQAAVARKNAIENLQSNFILRNKFTISSVRFTPCPKNITKFENIMSVIGALERADYLERQEKSGTRTPKKGNRLAIPTTAARGGSNTSLIRQKYRTGNLQRVDRNSTAHGTYRGNLVAAAYIAAKNRLVLNYYNQIYSVDNFKKTNDLINFGKTEIYNKNYKSTFTPKNEWLNPAIQKPAQDAQKIFNQQTDILFN